MRTITNCEESPNSRGTSGLQSSAIASPRRFWAGGRQTGNWNLVHNFRVARYSTEIGAGKIKEETGTMHWSIILRRSGDLVIQAERAKRLEIGPQKKLWTYQGLDLSPDATKGQLILDETASRRCRADAVCPAVDLRHGACLALTPPTCVLLRSEISAM